MSKTTQVLTTKTTIDSDTKKSNTTESWINADLPVDVSTHDIPVSSSIKDIDQPWYILYWIDQYNTLPKPIRRLVRQSIEKPEYFRDFSESIAALLNIEFIKDNSVVPVSDIATNISAYTYSRVLDFVLTQENVNLHQEMSVKTNNMFKINMTYIKDDDNVSSKLSTDAHGRNLVTDSQHYVRMSNIINDLKSLIEQKLGLMYPVLQFIQSNISTVKFDKWRSRILVESTCYDVDLFGNRLFDTDSKQREHDINENTMLDTQEIPAS